MAINVAVNSGRSLLLFYSVLKQASGNTEKSPLPSRAFPLGGRMRVERDLSAELQPVHQEQAVAPERHIPFQSYIHFVTFNHTPHESLAKPASANASLAALGLKAPLMFSAPGKNAAILLKKPVPENLKKNSLCADINKDEGNKKVRLN